MKRCMRCILPSTVPGIQFDAEGVCSFCKVYRPYSPLGKEALVRAIAGTAKKGKYHCIVALSGGRDSSYALWLAKKELGLEVLAVNYDNEFRIPQALANMQKATRTLGVDFETVVSKYGLAKKIVLSGIRAQLSSGLTWTAGDACRACIYGYRSLVYMKAIEHSIPLIFWGETSFEATQDMEALASRSLQTTRRQKYLSPDFYKAELYALLHRCEFHAPGNNILDRRKPPELHAPGITEIRIFDYMPWDRRKLKDVITGELGWQAPEGSATTWRIDCALHSLVNYCYVKLFGCTKDSFGLSRMVCGGQMTRDEALERETSCTDMVQAHIDELLQHIGLERAEIEKLKVM